MKLLTSDLLIFFKINFRAHFNDIVYFCQQHAYVYNEFHVGLLNEKCTDRRVIKFQLLLVVRNT